MLLYKLDITVSIIFLLIFLLFTLTSARPDGSIRVYFHRGIRILTLNLHVTMRVRKKI